MRRTTSRHQEYVLPSDQPDQVYVSVSPIVAGSITLPDKAFVAPADPNAKRTVPSLAFLIKHPRLSPESIAFLNRSLPFSNPIPTSEDLSKHEPFNVLFDLGLRSSLIKYLPAQQQHLERNRVPYRLDPGVAQQLTDGGVAPENINLVLLSHVHYDHHGDPEAFPSARFVVGAGALDVLKHGLKGHGAASHQHFQEDLLPPDRSAEFADPRKTKEWMPVGPFPSALDLLGDGSLYVIDCPGHLPGHFNLLCRIGPERWVCLCGDAYHDRRLLTGEKDIGFWEAAGGEQMCIHLVPDEARQSIDRLRLLMNVEGVELVAAHDDGWLAKNRDKLFPNIL